MKSFKRILSTVLVLCLCASILPAAFAADVTTPTISSSSVSAEQGSSFELPIYIQDTYDLAALQIIVQFDPSSLELAEDSLYVPAEMKAIFNVGFSISNNNYGEAKIIIGSMNTVTLQTKKELLCRIKFNVKSGAKVGETPVSFIENSHTIAQIDKENNGKYINVTPNFINDFNVKITKKSSNNSDDSNVKPTPTPSPTPSFVPVKSASLSDVQEITSAIEQTGKNASEYEKYKANDYAQIKWNEFTNVQYNPNKVTAQSSVKQATLSLEDISQGTENAALLAPFLSAAVTNSGAIDMMDKTVSIQFPMDSSVTKYELTLKSDFFSVWSGDLAYESLTLKTPVFHAQISIDILETILAQSPSGCKMIFEKSQRDGLPAFQLSIGDLNGKELTDVYQDGVVLMLPVSLNEIGAATAEEAYVIDASGDVIASSVFVEQEGKFYAAMKSAGSVSFGYGSVSFGDLSSVSWAETYINGLAARKILSGVGDGMFDPNRNITREEFTKMIVGAFGILDETATCDFTDVPEDSWYYPYVATAAKYGLVNGMGNGEFGVSIQISRQDMATLAKRAADYCQRHIRATNAQIVFADDADIQSYAKASITSMQMAGIISGTGNNRFEPNAYSTRAQAAKVIYMLFASIK